MNLQNQSQNIISNHELILNYINDMTILDVIDASGLAEELHIKQSDARHHLNKFTKRGLICKVKINLSVYYCDRCWIPLFKLIGNKKVKYE